MSEITHVLVSRASRIERDALARFIREERPDLGEGDAWRLLACEALRGMGLLGEGGQHLERPRPPSERL